MSVLWNGADDDDDDDAAAAAGRGSSRLDALVYDCGVRAEFCMPATLPSC